MTPLARSAGRRTRTLLPRSLAGRVLLGLVLGLSAGMALALATDPRLRGIPGLLEPVGTLWVNAIRITVIPLVLTLLVGAVAGAPDQRGLGRVGGVTVALFVTLLIGGTAISIAVGAPLLHALHIDPAASAALRAGADAAPAPLPGWRAWLLGLVPPNAFQAAADGAMIPLILFALAFGLALGQVHGDGRDTLLRGVRAIAEAMLVLVRWVLALAPVGVFALALPLAARLGAAAAGAIAYYVAVVAGLSLLLTALLYPLTAWLGRVRLRDFARAAAPAQAVAFSSRSSMAALPALMESAGERLHLSEEVVAFVIPLAASTFRLGGTVGQTVGALFLARLYGIELGPAQLVAVAGMSVIMTFAIPGIPGGAILVLVPILLAVGLPAAGAAILLGIDTVPDMFRTTTNITADLGVAAIASARRHSAQADRAPARPGAAAGA